MRQSWRSLRQSLPQQPFRRAEEGWLKKANVVTDDRFILPDIRRSPLRSGILCRNLGRQKEFGLS
jgi:hypothetical protein